ncbi:MAG: TetR/AcrR family transcriptional regulator [Bacteroidota bacterium]
MELKERIIRKAGEMFAMYGIRSVTMDSISEELGISKRTLYETFTDKNTLLTEVLLFHKESQEKLAQEIIENADNVIEAMVEIMRNSVEIMKSVNPLFFHDMKKYHIEIHESLMKKGEVRNYNITRSILEKGIKQGVFQDFLDIEIVNHTIHSLFNLFADESKFPLTSNTREVIWKNTIRPYLKGICTDKGCKLIDQFKL